MRDSNVAELQTGSDEFLNERYLRVLQNLSRWVTIADWAQEVARQCPDILKTADEQAARYAKPSTGIREIAARLSSQISRGAYEDRVEVDASERPKKVRWLSAEDSERIAEAEAESEIGRREIISRSTEAFSAREYYRFEEFENIIDNLNDYFELDLELDHAHAILNREEPGRHHPDNFQILTKIHNRKKSDSNWQRFTIDEQIEYIQAIIDLQKIIAPKLRLEVAEDVLSLLMDRLRNIY